MHVSYIDVKLFNTLPLTIEQNNLKFMNKILRLVSYKVIVMFHQKSRITSIDCGSLFECPLASMYEMNYILINNLSNVVFIIFT